MISLAAVLVIVVLGFFSKSLGPCGPQFLPFDLGFLWLGVGPVALLHILQAVLELLPEFAVQFVGHRILHLTGLVQGAGVDVAWILVLRDLLVEGRLVYFGSSLSLWPCFR